MIFRELYRAGEDSKLTRTRGPGFLLTLGPCVTPLGFSGGRINVEVSCLVLEFVNQITVHGAIQVYYNNNNNT